MSLTRQVTFWVVTLAVVVLALWLLREILLPLVAGGLALRTVLAWLQRAYRGRPHAAV